MKVFISWSGDESRQIAEALRDWLPMIFESVQPYMSARDNEAGVRWSGVIAAELDESYFGLLCLTPTNLTAPWLLFEAGALSKSVDAARVVPLLWKLSTADVMSPLSQFHMKSADKTGIHDVIRSINAVLERPRSDEVLTGIFDALWPRLEGELNDVKPPTAAQSAKPHRKDRELLEEILELMRTARQEATPPTSLSARLQSDNTNRRRRRRDLEHELATNLPTGFDWMIEAEGDSETFHVIAPDSESFERAAATDLFSRLSRRAKLAGVGLQMEFRRADT